MDNFDIAVLAGSCRSVRVLAAKPPNSRISRGPSGPADLPTVLGKFMLADVEPLPTNSATGAENIPATSATITDTA